MAHERLRSHLVQNRGRLFIIATPIGNLEDLSPRALRALKSCDLLLCEDTRHTQKLLTHFGVEVKAESYHEHNERARTEEIVKRLESGLTVGIVTDAGMPTLSDPGYLLMKEARNRGIVVEPIPGAFAGALALVASGLPPLPFAFFGFAPHRSEERKDFFREVLRHGMTSVVYESPHRIVASLEDAQEVFGDVPMTLAREMTKLHEEFLHGTISEVRTTLASRDAIYGEMTLVFAAATVAREEATHADLAREFATLREQGLKRTDAIKVLADRHGLSKRDLYQQLLDTE
jgi:16S rRNA (cytidine1402-2'-O)-methyltransferase